ncbi:hypothetical protein DOY81_012961 [Sarcophaga bullata]|nr:hypothetical protein DOY81_012961 [Sarcophaga bullata]
MKFGAKQERHHINRSLKDNILRSQPLDKQQIMAQWFEDLILHNEMILAKIRKSKRVHQKPLSCSIKLGIQC